MKAFEDASGKKLDEDKKELASEELITTGDLGDDIGQDKATGVINDVKTEIIKNGTHDTNQIAQTINNVTNNYNVTLTDAQVKQITDLMEKIAAQNYDYNSMKETLNNVSDVVQDNLKESGEDIKGSGFFSSIKDWFTNLFKGNKDLGILQDTKDDMLGSNAVINATDKAAEYLPTAEEAEGFFQKIVNWVKNLFSGDSKDNNNTDNNENQDINENSQNSQENQSNDSNMDNSKDNQEDSNNDSLNVQTESEDHFDSQDNQQN